MDSTIIANNVNSTAAPFPTADLTGAIGRGLQRRQQQRHVLRHAVSDRYCHEDPGLHPLQDNGGPTRTHMPTPGQLGHVRRHQPAEPAVGSARTGIPTTIGRRFPGDRRDCRSTPTSSSSTASTDDRADALAAHRWCRRASLIGSTDCSRRRPASSAHERDRAVLSGVAAGRERVGQCRRRAARRNGGSRRRPASSSPIRAD